MKKKATASTSTTSVDDLRLALTALDPLWAERLPALSLRPGSADAASVLANAIGVTLPEELVVWFSWHDGQTSFDAVSDESTFFLHSAASAVEAYAFLRGEAEGYAPSWVPLFENGGGDHRVYDLASGAIVTYWHDDVARPVAFPSLLAWAAATRASLEKMAPAKKVKVSLDGLAWKKVSRAPASVGACPPGTLFHYPMKLPMGLRHKIAIKLAGDEWLTGSGADFEHALAQLAQHLEKPPGKSSGYWKSDGTIAYDVKTYARGLRQSQAGMGAR